MQEGVQIIDPNFRYLYLNKAAVEQGKRNSADELVGHTMMEMYPGIEKTELFEKIKEALEKKVATYIENEFKFPDGSKGWFELRIRSIPEGVFILSLDITDNKNNEKTSEERERLFKEAQLVAHLGVYRTDFTKNKWESSEVLDEIFGIGKDYVHSVDGWASLIHPDDRKMMTDYLQNEVFAKKLNFDKEYRIIQKNSGRARWVHGLGEMTFDKQNKPLTMVGTIQDITERKTEEISLGESENRYRTLVDVAPLCIKWFDENGKLISINQHGKEEHFLVGKSDDEIRNWNYIECIVEKYRGLVKENLSKALGGKSSEFDMEHVPGTSTGHWCHSYMVPAMDDKGKVKYVLFISRDFTSEKIAEDEKNKNLEILKKFKELTIGRELKMMELKKKIAALREKYERRASPRPQSGLEELMSKKEEN
jgi:PAS domain S-box-containing protein